MYPGRTIPRPHNKTISPAGGLPADPSTNFPGLSADFQSGLNFFDSKGAPYPAPSEPGVDSLDQQWASRFETDLAPGETRSLQINPNNDGVQDGTDAILLSVDGGNPAVGFSKEIYIVKESDDHREGYPGDAFKPFATITQLTDSEIPQLLYGGIFSEAIVLIEDAQGPAPIQFGSNDDSRSGSDGVDVIYAGAGDDTISGGAGNDTLRGEQGNDLLQGDDGEDTLFGEAGTDRLKGGNSNDYLNGGSGNDTLFGNSGDDEIDGMMGDDILTGGAGSDTLRGGTGADHFDFSNPSLDGVDTVEDFNVAEDKIGLYVGNTGSGFKTAGLAVDAPIAANQFKVGTAAASASDRLIYDSTTGQLFFDADGTGAIAQVQIAVLSPGLALTNKNFVTFDDPPVVPPPQPQPQPQPHGATNGDDKLIGGDGNDSLSGLGGNDQLIGNAGNDTLNGGTGNDRLDGGLGKDQLIGGLGRDVFLLEKKSGRDIIRDFTDHRDRLSLPLHVTFRELTLSSTGNGTLIRLGNDPLALLKNVQSNQITAADFVGSKQ